MENTNVKIFNLMSRVNETRFLVRHESCECKYGLNESVCNSKQKRNCGEYRCDFKDSILCFYAYCILYALYPYLFVIICVLL